MIPRDLFDLAEGLLHVPAPDPQRVVDCFERYLQHDGLRVSRSEMLANLEAKVADPAFGRDLRPLLAPGVVFDATAAAGRVKDDLIAHIR